MNLMHPLLAWGTLLGAIPIIIYLLFRRRYRIIRWAAMEFLLRAIKEESKRVRIQDMILLALRVLALVVAAMVVARPMLAPGTSGPLAGRAPDVVIIVDRSYSMTTTVTAVDRLTTARKLAHDLLESLPADTHVGVIHMSDQAVRATEGLTTDRALIARALDSAQAACVGADLIPAIATALEWLKQSSAPEKRIYLVTDAQANLFAPRLDALRGLLTQVDETVGFVVVTVPNDRVGNLAVTDLQIANRWVQAGAPVQINVTIRDMGQPVQTQAGVELWVDGRKVNRQTVQFTERQARAGFQHTFTAAGLYSIEARLDPDAVALDNHRYLPLCVPASIGVAVIAPEARNAIPAFTFIEAAIAPADVTDAKGSTPPFQVWPSLTPQRLADGLDESIRAAILADPGVLSSEAVAQLQSFVDRGGSLMISSGADAAATLGSFRSSESGIAAILRGLDFEVPQTAAADNPRPLQFNLPPGPTDSGGELPVLALETPGLREAISNVQVFHAVRFDFGSAPEWSVPLKLSDSRAAIAVRNLLPDAPGKLILLSTTLDTRWTDLPYRSAMVPLLQDLLTWTARHHQIGGTLAPGQTWIAAAGSTASMATRLAGRRIVPPHGEPLDPRGFAQVDATGKRSSVRFDRLDQPGIYRLDGTVTTAATALDAIAVNVDPAESDQATWSAAQIEAIFPAGRCRVLPADATGEAMVSAGATGREMWAWLASLLGVFLLIETYLAYRFGTTGGSSPILPATAGRTA